MRDRDINWLGLVQAAVLTGWVTALGWLCRGSREDALLGHFLRADYWWIVYIAVWLFAALLASLVFSQPRELGLHRRRSLIQVILLSLPLLYLPLAVRSELSIEAAERRSFFTQGVVVKQSGLPKPMEVGSAPRIQERGEGSGDTPRAGVSLPESPQLPRTQGELRTSLSKPISSKTPVKSHEANLWDLISNPEAFKGSNAIVTGSVYQDDKLSKDSFLCYRLLMVCCAADAMPVGVIVKWRDAPKLKKGAWVRVRGRVVFTVVEGEKWPAIQATRVERMSPPKIKFLIPG